MDSLPTPKSLYEGVKSVLPKPVNEPARKLSEKEAEELRPALIEATRDYMMYADQFIDATTKGGKKDITIWSDMSDRELETLVDSWLKRARTSPKAARRVRRAISVQQDVIGPVMVLGPRFIKTMQTYRELGLDLTGNVK